MRRLRRLAGPLLIAMLLCLTPATAYAGSNGQQIHVYAAYTSNSVYISGTNQDNQPRQLCFGLPSIDNNWLWNFWWKFTTNLYFYTDGACGDFGGALLGFVETWIPPNQPGDDWWHVRGF